MTTKDLASMADEVSIELAKFYLAANSHLYYEAAAHGERIKDLGRTMEAVAWFLHRQKCDAAGVDPYDFESMTQVKP